MSHTTSVGPDHPSHNPLRLLTRRGFIQVGAASTFGLMFSPFMDTANIRAAQAAAREPSTYIRRTGRKEDSGNALVILNCQGGWPHFSLWDPRITSSDPLIRGPFNAIETNVKGVYFSELLEELAKMMDQMLVFRNVYHTNGAHDKASSLFLTGKSEGVTDIEKDSPYPSPFIDYSKYLLTKAPDAVGYGVLHFSLKTYDEPWKKPFPGVQWQNPETFFGPWNGKEFENPFPALDDLPRYRARRELLKKMQEAGPKLSGPAIDRHNALQRQVDLHYGGPLSKAFNLSEEPLALRERYGMNLFGMQLLIGRRMLEAGVRVLNLVSGDWDLHADEKKDLPRLARPFSRGVTAFLEDLKQRGLLKKTLVAIVSEFGRAPKMTFQPLHSDPGRAHWPFSNSAVLVGAGVPGGQVVGETGNDGNIKGKEAAIPAAEIAESLFRRGTGYGRYEMRGGVPTDKALPHFDIP